MISGGRSERFRDSGDFAPDDLRLSSGGVCICEEAIMILCGDPACWRCLEQCVRSAKNIVGYIKEVCMTKNGGVEFVVGARAR